MKIHARLYRAAITAAWFFVPCIAMSQEQQLSLKPGIYVRHSFSCKDAPNAVIMGWNGVGFSGAHSSQCTSRVLSHHATRYRMSTTCAALGDGSPTPPGAQYVDLFLLTRLSNTSFQLRQQNQPQGTFRWCSAKAPE